MEGGGGGEEGLGPVGNLDILRLLVQLSGRSVCVCLLLLKGSLLQPQGSKMEPDTSL